MRDDGLDSLDATLVRLDLAEKLGTSVAVDGLRRSRTPLGVIASGRSLESLHLLFFCSNVFNPSRKEASAFLITTLSRIRA